MGDISLQDLATAMALSYGGFHPWSHISEANKLGVRGKVDYRNMWESVDPVAWNKLTSGQQAKIHGAGFEGQQTFSNALQGSRMEDEARLAQALYKLGYISGIKPGKTGGDPELISKTTGISKGKINSMLGISALTDLYRSKNPGNGSLDFGILDEGRAPGLIYQRKW